MEKQKRVLTIQDYSCLGRCSLTVALPVLSSLGIECVGIPSMVLSNHTAGFASWEEIDLEEKILPILKKWDNYNHHFDAIYTGYLPTKQIAIMEKVFQKVKEKDTGIYIDPCFGDNGKIYPGFNEEHVKRMKEYIHHADVLLPNLTEACFLTDTPYKEDYSLIDVLPILDKLCSLGIQKIVLSGFKEKENQLTSIVYQKEKKIIKRSTPYYPYLFHGTGDLFASSYIGLSLLGIKDEEILSITHKFIDDAISDTLKEGTPSLCYGVNFERALPTLIKEISKES